MQHAGWDVQLSGVSTKTGSIFVLAVSSWSRRLFCCSSYISNSVSLLDLFQERVRSFDFLILFRRMEETCYWFVFDFLILFSSSFVSGQSFPFLLFYPILYFLFSFSIQFFVIFGSPYSACVVCRAMGAARIVSSLLSLYPSPFLIALSTVQSRRTESRYFSLPSFDLFICLVCLFVIFFPPPVLFSFLFWLFSRCFCSRQSPVCLFPIVAFCQKNRKIEKGKNNERGETKKIGEKNRRREKRKKRRDKARDTHDWSRSQFKTSAICGQLFVR